MYHHQAHHHSVRFQFASRGDPLYHLKNEAMLISPRTRNAERMKEIRKYFFVENVLLGKRFLG